MIRRLCLSVGIAFALCSGTAHASMFDTFFDGAAPSMPWRIPPDDVVKFAIHEMELWNKKGILLFPGDIEAAMLGDTRVLCTDKVDMEGSPIKFAIGSLGELDGCQKLLQDITTTIDAQIEVDSLASDLLTISNGSELAIADQPHRPAQVATPVLLANRLWSGTGTRIIPWPGGPDTEADKLFAELVDALSADEHVDQTVWRFQHGYFRDLRDNDPALQDYGEDVQEVLQKLAAVLNIVGDPADRGEFATPDLPLENIGFWARGDDLGLMWITPEHIPHIGDILPADQYPTYVEGGDALAYPFTYQGNTPSSASIYASPLCSRSASNQGYLCRHKPSPTGLCDREAGTAIDLITCNPVTRETPGPDICSQIHKTLFEDTGLPLADPADPRFVNPNLKPANTGSICNPEYRVLYKDEVTAHACYIAACLRQSMSGHTLITNRSPVVVGEATSPFLGCMRPDPELGLYAELARTPSVNLPDYIGLGIVNDVGRGYCAKVGQLPHAVSSYCTYLSNRRVNSIEQTLAATTASTAQEYIGADADLADFTDLATIVGQRTVIDQAYPVYRKLIESLAQAVQETANLLNDLKLAPLTKSVCPYTGAFTKP